MDVTKLLQEHELKDEGYQSKWSEIRNAKLKEIKNAYDSLSFLDDALRKFGSSEERSFKTFKENLREEFQKTTGNDSLTELFPPEPVDDNRARLIATLSRDESFLRANVLIASPGYTPPENIPDVLSHLFVFWVHFQTLRPGPQLLNDMCMDLSLIKLIGAVNKLYQAQVQYGERELNRTRKSTSTKKATADARKGIILAIYNHGNKIPPEINFSQVYKILEGQFNESRGDKDKPWGLIPDKIKFPSHDTLTLWFKQEGIFEKDFIKREKRLITKM